MADRLIFTGQGPAPVFPEGADRVSGSEGLALFQEYLDATNDRDCGDMNVVAAWVAEKYGAAKSAGFLWRTNFAF